MVKIKALEYEVELKLSLDIFSSVCRYFPAKFNHENYRPPDLYLKMIDENKIEHNNCPFVKFGWKQLK